VFTQTANVGYKKELMFGTKSLQKEEQDINYSV